MAVTADVIRSLTIKYKTEGETALRRSLDGIGYEIGGMEKSVLSAGMAFEKSMLRMDASARAQKQLMKEISLGFRAFEQGAISVDTLTSHIDLATQKFGQLKVAANSAEAALAKVVATNAKRAQINKGFDEILGVKTDFGTKSRAEDISAFAKGLDDTRAKYNPLFAAGLQYRRQLQEMRNDFKLGAISAKEYADSLARLKAETQRQVGEARGDRVNKLGMMPGTRMRQHQVTNLSYQLNDVVSGLAMGQPANMVAMQQGGQILQILQDHPEGLKGSIKDVGTLLGGLLTPMRLVIGGFTGIGVAAVMAFNSAEARIVAMTQALNGLGQRSGLTVSQLQRVAESAASTGGLSVSQAGRVAGSYAGAGIDGGLVGGLTSSTRNFAKAFGLDLEEAGKMLAQALAQPAKGAEELHQKFGFLSDATIQQIKFMSDAGNVAGAQAMLYRSLNSSMATLSVRTTTFGSAMEQVGIIISNIWNKFGSAFTERTTEQKFGDSFEIARVQRSTFSWAQGRFAAKDPIGEAFTRMTIEWDRAIMAKADARTRELSVAAGNMVREIFPEEVLRKTLTAKVKALNDAIARGADIEGGPDKVKEAIDRYGGQLAFLLTPLQKLEQETKFNVAATLAMTAAQRAHVEAARVYARAMDDAKGSAYAAAAAEAVRTQAIAEGLKQARDANRTAREQESLAGLLPAQRAAKQIEIDMANLRRQTEVGAGGNYAAMFQPFKNGLDIATNALQALANAANSAANKGGIAGAGVAGSDGSEIAGAATRLANGFNSIFAAKLGQLQSQFPELRMTSGVRSLEEQQVLRARYGAGAAVPGTSRHEVGLAADFSGRGMTGARREEIIAAARAMGLEVIPSNNGAMHIQGPRGWAAGGRQGDAAAMAGETKAHNDNTKAVKENAIAREQWLQLVTMNELAVAGQENALRSQIAAFGGSVAAVAAAAEKQRLLNEAMRQGVNVSPEMEAAFDRIASRVGNLASKTEEFRYQMSLLNDLRSMSGDFISSFAGGLARGEKAADALRNSVNNLIQSLIRMATNMMLRGLFGDQNMSGGLLSSLLQGLVPGTGGMALPDGGHFVPNANGNAYFNGLHRFANGGAFTNSIVDRPTMFRFGRGGALGQMGEAGPEAIMPLSRGPDGRLGVTASNDNRSGGMAPMVIFEDHTEPKNIEQREERQPDGRMATRFILTTIKDAEASGDFDNTRKSRYAQLPRRVFR
ncbi:MAG: phage tail length tape measure family protein [Sterolibacterium sp.]